MRISNLVAGAAFGALLHVQVVAADRITDAPLKRVFGAVSIAACAMTLVKVVPPESMTALQTKAVTVVADAS